MKRVSIATFICICLQACVISCAEKCDLHKLARHGKVKELKHCVQQKGADVNQLIDDADFLKKELNWQIGTTVDGLVENAVDNAWQVANAVNKANNIVCQNGLGSILWNAVGFGGCHTSGFLAKMLVDVLSADQTAYILKEIMKWGIPGVAPLHIAAYEHQNDAVIELLKLGANPSIPVKLGAFKTGTTPLHIAVRHENIKLVQTLLAFGADSNSVDEKSETPLHLAAKEKNQTHLEITRLLLNSPAIDCKKADGSGTLPAALATDNLPTLELFIQKKCMDKNTATKLLLYAVVSGSFQMTNALLDQGADVNGFLYTTNFFGNEKAQMFYPPIIYAAATDNLVILDLLLNRAADDSVKVACPDNVEGKQQCTALDIAEAYGNTIIALRLEGIWFMQYLIDFWNVLCYFFGTVYPEFIMKLYAENGIWAPCIVVLLTLGGVIKVVVFIGKLIMKLVKGTFRLLKIVVPIILGLALLSGILEHVFSPES